MSVPSELIAAMNNAVSGINGDTRVDICLIKKTSSKKEEKKFTLGTVELVDEVPTAFRSIITKKLNDVLGQIANNTVTFKPFFDIEIKKEDISELQSSEIPQFKYIRDKMRSFSTIPPINNLREIKHFESYALEFHLDDENIVYFTKIPTSQLITRKFGLTLALNRGKFNKVKGDIFGFDNEVDCIYFEETDSFLILDKYGMEKIFNFKLYYQQKTREAFSSLTTSNLITVNSQLLDDIKENTRYTRKITALFKTGKFNRDIEWFKQHQSYFTQKNLTKELSQLKIEQNLVVIDNKDKLSLFLAICNDEFVEQVISHKPYLASVKEDLVV